MSHTLSPAFKTTDDNTTYNMKIRIHQPAVRCYTLNRIQPTTFMSSVDAGVRITKQINLGLLDPSSRSYKSFYPQNESNSQVNTFFIQPEMKEIF